MLTKKLTRYRHIVLLSAILLFCPVVSLSQVVNDTLPADTAALPSDSIEEQARKPSFMLEARVDYEAHDSIVMDFSAFKAYMYGNYHKANIQYQQIELNGGYVMLDFNKSLIFSKGFFDSTGTLINKPEFTERDQEYKTREIFYNISTKKGFIRSVVTSEGQGYILSDSIKKLPNDHINISSGSYTTCTNHEHPHFEIHFGKAKVIPKDKIITGPAFLKIEDIPTPLIVPFGLFPNQSGQSSGIIIPRYGEAGSRGFFLEDGGYYFAINDTVDLAITGGIYSRGSWGMKAFSNYKIRYKFSGNISASYSATKLGDKDSPDYESGNDYKFIWKHNQDPKAHPKNRFTADVNIISSSYNKYNNVSINDKVSNTFKSSVGFTTNFGGLFSFNASLTHDYNTKTKMMTMTLPRVAIASMKRFYPFKRKNPIGGKKWFEDINVSYSMNTINSVQTIDSLFKDLKFKDFNNGIHHTARANSTFSLLNYINVSNTATYNERWYFRYFHKSWNSGTVIQGGDTITGYIDTDTLTGMRAARDFNISSTFSTKIYMFYNFDRGWLKRLPINKIRHVIDPSVQFSYAPGFGAYRWGYYKHYQVPTGGIPIAESAKYSVFESLPYGSPPDQESGRVTFAIGNNLEMKARSKKDTVTGFKKTKLIESLRISTSYDVAKDSIRWAPLLLSARTTLLEKFIIDYSGAWNFYQIDSNERLINRFQYEKNGHLLRKTSAMWRLSVNYALSSQRAKNKP
ncbi:MAG: putative LPS assembly protein LptD, partial [Bacteroidales bacterium]|nr:putative LPS assembly protein LptD [Bacteroidales bacterium]